MAELYGLSTCVLNKTISFLSPPFSVKKNGIFLFLSFILLNTLFFFGITKCCCSSYWCVSWSALQRDCCLLPVSYREENRGREWWKLALNRVSSRSLEVAGRDWVFWALAQCPVRQGNGNILSIESERAYFLGQLEWICLTVTNSSTKNVYFFSVPIYMVIFVMLHQRMSVLKKEGVRQINWLYQFSQNKSWLQFWSCLFKCSIGEERNCIWVEETREADCVLGSVPYGSFKLVAELLGLLWFWIGWNTSCVMTCVTDISGSFSDESYNEVNNM